MDNWIKYLIFRFTPHLFFDKIWLSFARVDHRLLELLRGQKNIYIFLGCDYGNLGDYAITKAQTALLKQMFPDRKVFVFNVSQTYKGLKTVLKHGVLDDIITIIGGGNIGDLYYGYERKRNLIISKCINYTIYSFPQTLCFSDSPLGRLTLRRSVETYKVHNQLIMMARDNMSYEKMKDIMGNYRVRLVPDIVLTYRPSLYNERKGIVTCLRNDREAFISKEEQTKIVKKLKEGFGIVTMRDTCVSSTDNLEKSFFELLYCFSSALCVVTDRLHGMILAYITNTPVIAFPNNNGKILQSYEWIKDCDRVKICDDIEKLNYLVREVLNVHEDIMPKDFKGFFEFIKT